MAVKRDIEDETHRVLAEALDDYDPEAVEANVEEWLKRVPPGDEPVEPEAETDGGPES